MYSILLVDDEQIVRVALKSLIDWESNGLRAPYEAANGQQALDMMRLHPDIDLVITDINMPVMDGLALIQALNELEQPPQVIVLSAYDDYSLVRGAFKLGINDYIIKSRMEPDQVLKTIQDTLNRAACLAEKEGIRYSSHEKQTYLRKLLQGPASPAEEKDLKHYEIRFDERNLVVCTLLIDGYESIRARYIENTLEELSKNMLETLAVSLENVKKSETVCLSPQEYVIIMSFELHSKSRIHDAVEEMLARVRHHLFNYMNMGVSAGISAVGSGIASLPELYGESAACARYRFLFGKGHNIYPEQIRGIVQSDHGSILACREPLLKALADADKTAALAALNSVLDLIGTFKCTRIDQISNYYMELVFIIIHYLHDTNKASVNIFEHNTDFLSIIHKFETKDEVDAWIRNLLGNLMEYLAGSRKDSQYIQMAKEYVRDNYMNKCALADVSAYLGLSEGYFSALFSQEHGESFVHYLTVWRIEQAKRLLARSNMKIYEICEAIGYENVEHFSRVFKKIVGVSPLQYKNR